MFMFGFPEEQCSCHCGDYCPITKTVREWQQASPYTFGVPKEGGMMQFRITHIPPMNNVTLRLQWRMKIYYRTESNMFLDTGDIKTVHYQTGRNSDGARTIFQDSFYDGRLVHFYKPEGITSVTVDVMSWSDGSAVLTNAEVFNLTAYCPEDIGCFRGSGVLRDVDLDLGAQDYFLRFVDHVFFSSLYGNGEYEHGEGLFFEGDYWNGTFNLDQDQHGDFLYTHECAPNPTSSPAYTEDLVITFLGVPGTDFHARLYSGIRNTALRSTNNAGLPSEAQLNCDNINDNTIVNGWLIQRTGRFTDAVFRGGNFDQGYVVCRPEVGGGIANLADYQDLHVLICDPTASGIATCSGLVPESGSMATRIGCGTGTMVPFGDYSYAYITRYYPDWSVDYWGRPAEESAAVATQLRDALWWHGAEDFGNPPWSSETGYKDQQQEIGDGNLNMGNISPNYDPPF